MPRFSNKSLLRAFTPRALVLPTLIAGTIACSRSTSPVTPTDDTTEVHPDDALAALDTAPDTTGDTASDTSNDTTTQPTLTLPAFPGAEGFGAIATGGRGGRVVKVTTLAANGPGTLQAALDMTGPRTIVFETSGVIDGVPILQHGDVTIAGQTSPGGIVLRGLLIQGDEVCEAPSCPMPTVFPENFIVRHVRIRPAGIDDPNGAGDGLRLHHARRGILDHISIGNAEDEAVQISFASDITLQWSLLAETVGSHAEFGGMLINYSDPARGFPLTRLSIHHVMWNRIVGRVPELSRENVPDAGLMELELSNNVLHDVERPIYLAAANPQNNAPLHYAMNLVGNTISADPALAQSYGLLAIELGPQPMTMTASSTAYLHDNTHSLTPDRSDWQLVYCCNDFKDAEIQSLPWPSNDTPPPFARSTRHPFPPITYDPSGRALVERLAREAGAFPRDPMDTRLMRDPFDGTFARSPSSENPSNDALTVSWSTAPTPPTDTDEDGMPDGWEQSQGLDPADVSDGNGLDLSRTHLGVNGYTNLEVYLHIRHIEVTATTR